MNLDLLQHQPVDFIELAFQEELWSKQREICNSIRDNRYTTVKSCFDSGKSFIASRIVNWFLTSFPNSKVITTAPTFRQVQDILWREVRAARAKAIVDLGGQTNLTSINLGENWFAVGLSTDDPTRFQGYHAVNILVIVDEAAGVDEAIFNASEGLLSSDGARCLYIGNPTTIEGMFYRSFNLPNFHKISISAFDTPNFTTFGITQEDIEHNTWRTKITVELPAPYLVTPDWVADKYLRWGVDSPMYQAMVLGVFPEQGEDTLIPLGKIEKAAVREGEPNPEDAEEIGVDIARFGVDKTVFILRKGMKVLDIKEFSHMDTVQTSGHLRTYMGFHPAATVKIDEVGVGAGVLDNVKASEPYKSVTGVNVGLPAHNPEMFINLRAEMFWNLRERFVNDDIIIPDDEDLKSQLSTLKFEYTPKGQIKIESKDDMKKRGLPSPDKADALALAFGMVEQRPAIFDFYKTL
jgi:phage terminase large subunit